MPGRASHGGEPAALRKPRTAAEWAREFALAGVSVPLFPAEHFYVVTRRLRRPSRSAGDARPDGYIYKEVGGLVMGGFESYKPWKVARSERFEFQLLPEDWDQFEPLMANAIHRTLPGDRRDCRCSPSESFIDGNFIRQAPECAATLSALIQFRGHRQRRRCWATDRGMDRQR